MKNYLFAVISILFWSFNVIIAHVLANHLTPWQISGFRWSIAALLILPFALFSLKQNWQIVLKNKWWICWTALWGITINNTLVYYAAYTVRPVALSLIGVTGPLFLIFFSWLIQGKDLSKRQLFGLLFTLLGVFAIILYGRAQTMGEIHFERGDFWMLGAAITFGYYSFCVADKPKNLPYFPFFAASLIVGSLLCLPMFLWDTFSTPVVFLSNMNLDILGVLFFLGIFNSVLAYLLWNYALTKGDPIKISMIYYLMPVFSMIESWFILNDSIHWIQVVGAFVVFGGIYYSTKSTPQKKQSSS